MTAQEGILNLINQYGFTIDTGDLDGFANLFEHGEWTVEGAKPNIGKQQVLDAIAPVIIYENGTPRTKHVTSNVNITIDDAYATATAQCYVTVFQQTDDFPLQAIFSGHYFDDFECVEGTWRYKKRLIRHALVGDLSAHLGNLSNIPD